MNAPQHLSDQDARDVVGRRDMALIDATKNLAVFLRFFAALDPGRPALYLPDGDGGHDVVTYGEIDERGGRMGEVLAQHGLAPGDRVLLLVPVSRALYPLLFGILARGGVAVVVDPSIERSALRAALAAARPKFFVGVAKAHLLRVLPELRGCRAFLVGDGPGFVAPRLDRLADALPRGPRPLTVLDDDAPALITFTTGSTGAPKGALRTHALLNAQGDVIARAWPRVAGDVDLATLPIFATTNLAAGIATVFPSIDLKRVDIDDDAAAVVVDQMARTGVTTLGGSPAFVGGLARYLADDPARAPAVRAQVRAVALGGAPVTPSIVELTKRAFPQAQVRVVYGCTEAEPVAIVDGDDVVASAAVHEDGGGCLVGAPAFTTVQLIDGEVCVSGAHVLDRYVDDAATAAAKVVVDGVVFHKTGDMARLDAHGRLWLLGRKTERVTARDGRTLWPLAVEAVAAARGVRCALVQRRADAVLVVEDLAHAARVKDLADDVVVLRGDSALPVDRRHRSRIDRRALRARLENA